MARFGRYVLRRIFRLFRKLATLLRWPRCTTGPDENENDSSDNTPLALGCVEPDELPLLAPPSHIDALINEAALSDNLAEMIRCRVSEIDEEEEDTLPWACRIIDLLDELWMMRQSFSENEDRQINILMNGYMNQLSTHACEVIDSDTWDSTVQRAVEIRESANHKGEPTIIEKLSYGLKFKEKLIRKQEVCLLSSPKSSQ